MTKTKKKTQTKPSQNYDMKVFYFILDLFLPVNQRDWEHVIAPAYEYVTGISRNWEAMRRKYKLLVKDHDTESIRIESIIAAKKGNQPYTNKWLGDGAVTAEVDEDDEDDDNDDDDDDDADADDADNNDDNTDADVDDTYDPDADPDPAVYGEEYDANDSIDFGFDATSERIDELTRENDRLTREVERLTRELEMTRSSPSSSSLRLHRLHRLRRRHLCHRLHLHLRRRPPIPPLHQEKKQHQPKVPTIFMLFHPPDHPTTHIVHSPLPRQQVLPPPAAAPA